MKPTTKTTLFVIGVVASVFIVPATIVLLKDFLNLIIFIVSVVSVFFIFAREIYFELLLFVQRHDIEEQKIFAGFNHDPEKIRFYKGFKKYFDGDLNAEQLKTWLMSHPRKH